MLEMANINLYNLTACLIGGFLLNLKMQAVSEKAFF